VHSTCQKKTSKFGYQYLIVEEQFRYAFLLIRMSHASDKDRRVYRLNMGAWAGLWIHDMGPQLGCVWIFSLWNSGLSRYIS